MITLILLKNRTAPSCQQRQGAISNVQNSNMPLATLHRHEFRHFQPLLTRRTWSFVTLREPVSIVC